LDFIGEVFANMLFARTQPTWRDIDANTMAIDPTLDQKVPGEYFLLAVLA
jgi:hypothetical protein